MVVFCFISFYPDPTMRFLPYPIAFLSIILLLSCAGRKRGKDIDFTKYVNPLIGTDWVGNTYPGATIPFGMVQLSPDNGKSGWDYIAGYYYPDTMIAGFSHTHLSGTGAGDLYDIRFMPIGKSSPDEVVPKDHIRTSFSHKNEKAEAGYYAVRLDNGIKVELTATEHCGIQRYTIQDSVLEVRLDLNSTMNWDRTTDSRLQLIDSHTISGYRFSDGWARDQRIFFRSRFSLPIEQFTIDSVPQYANNDTTQIIGYGLVAHLSFLIAKSDSTLTISTALSGMDEKGAANNLAKEAPHDDFDRYRAEASLLWQRALSRIVAEKGISPRVDTIFYTALYHSLLCPTVFSDADGRYRGADKKIHTLKTARKHYSTFSLWDTYRAAHPLYNILFPERAADMAESLVAFGEQNEGLLPVWTMWAGETGMMIGYHSIPVIVEAYRKGNYKENPQRIMRLLVSTMEKTSRTDTDNYRRLGYVPADCTNWSLSKTMEYAYDDACIALFARENAAAAKRSMAYAHHAKAYQEVYDPASGFFRPKLASGEWKLPFDPFEYTEDITESNAWQYLFGVQHDTEGLMELMGGADSMARRLDLFFGTPTPSHIALPIFSTGMIGQYAHGNEPSHHVAYLYNKVSQPWKGAGIIRRILTELYKNTPDGLCGNEDCGQLSAWYVFSALGFYPVDPISGHYELGSPLFEHVTIPQPNGRIFRLTAHNLSEKNRYIESVKVDGKPYHRSYITWNQIRSGAHVELFMTSREGHCWY